MSQSKLEVLEPRLVAVDSYHLSHLDEIVQDLSADAESLAYALNMIKTHDLASQGVIVAIRSTLFANSETAADLSIELGLLTLKPQIGVTSHE